MTIYLSDKITRATFTSQTHEAMIAINKNNGREMIIWAVRARGSEFIAECFYALNGQAKGRVFFKNIFDFTFPA